MRTHVNSVGLLVVSDPVLNFSYPAHIPRECIDALPSLPGIYIFRDAAGKPVYIGKSVNIRTRVLSHMRTTEEMQMLARAATIDFERTGGEIGALLRESELVKRHQPVFNSKLRRLREMCSISMGGRPSRDRLCTGSGLCAGRPAIWTVWQQKGGHRNAARRGSCT
ncbi:hypothetical protein [Pseudoduganella sp. R-34]|uniref:hypothetical protein n=1 Tax=Pseudoduganella sp. R-34 TaxID=3404062 RepID=UPI003CE9E9DA